MFSFPFAKNKATAPSVHLELKIAFHDDARYFGVHGRMQVSHKTKRLKGVPIVFVFPDMVTPPQLNPSMLAYIWAKAEAEGYIPHQLLEYGKDAEIVNFSKKEPVISTEAMHVLSHRLAKEVGKDIKDVIDLLARPVSTSEAIFLASEAEEGKGVNAVAEQIQNQRIVVTAE
jgi:hypothetical protein